LALSLRENEETDPAGRWHHASKNTIVGTNLSKVIEIQVWYFRSKVEWTVEQKKTVSPVVVSNMVIFAARRTLEQVVGRPAADLAFCHF
jgi:hypothetical protein